MTRTTDTDPNTSDVPRWAETPGVTPIDFELSEGAPTLRDGVAVQDRSFSRKLLGATGALVYKGIKFVSKPVLGAAAILLIGSSVHKGVTTKYDEIKNGNPAVDVATAAGPGEHVGCILFNSKNGTSQMVTATLDPKSGKAFETTYRRPNSKSTITISLDTVSQTPELNADGTPALDEAGQPKVKSEPRKGDNVDLTDEKTHTVVLRPANGGTITSVTLNVSSVDKGKDGAETISSTCQSTVSVSGLALGKN